MSIDTLVARAAFAIQSDATPSSALKTEIKWYLHVALREFCERADVVSLRVKGTVSVSAAGGATYDLPADFHRCNAQSVKFASSDYRTLTQIDRSEYDQRQYDRTQQSGLPLFFMIEGVNTGTSLSTITFWPTPSDTRNITVYYQAFPTKLYDLADGSNIDARITPEYHHHLVAGCCARIPGFFDDAQREFFNRDFERGIVEAQKKADKVVGEVRRIDRQAAFSVPPFRPVIVGTLTAPPP